MQLHGIELFAFDFGLDDIASYPDGDQTNALVGNGCYERLHPPAALASSARSPL
jgi:hypothetical protein